MNWHDEYADWVECYPEKNKMQIRSIQNDDKVKIKQALEIKYNDHIYTYNHDFLKTTYNNFSQFIESRELKINSRLIPYTLEEVNKETYTLPEVWVEIKNF